MHPLDNWSAGLNKATEMARKTYQDILKKRHKHEIWEKPNFEKVYYTCTSCVRYNKNHELYHRDELLMIPSNKGKITRRLCKKHAAKYVPHSQCGGLNLSY